MIILRVLEGVYIQGIKGVTTKWLGRFKVFPFIPHSKIFFIGHRLVNQPLTFPRWGFFVFEECVIDVIRINEIGWQIVLLGQPKIKNFFKKVENKFGTIIVKTLYLYSKFKHYERKNFVISL